MFEDFNCDELEGALRDVEPRLFSVGTKLEELAKASDLPESKRKAYGLLSEVCELYFRPDHIEDPLQPWGRLSDGRQTFSIDDLSDENLDFLGTVVDSFHLPKLRARIADILWLRRFKKAYEFGMKAINAYLEVPLSPDNWRVEEIGDQWLRGSFLALKLGKKDESFHGKTIPEHLFDRFEESSIENGAYLRFLKRLLILFPISPEQKRMIADKLDQSARFYDASNDFLETRDLLQAEKTVVEDSVALQSRIAESFEKEAQTRLPKLAGDHLRVQLLCNQLIEALRAIPEKRRAEFDVENRLKDAHAILVRCREHTTEDLKIIKSGPIDVSEMTERIIKLFQGRSLADALEGFARISSQDESSLRAEAERLIRKHPLLYIFSQHTLSEDGRIISETSGLTTVPRNEKEVAENEKVIAKATMEAYLRHIKISVEGILMPAFLTILEEHRFSFSDAVEIVRRSPLIPPNRYLAFARVLEFGFHGDHFSAIYILCPEIENVVRVHLHGFGVKTTTVDKDGIEQEVGLSSLMEHPEVAQCFGKNFAWELRALFCDPNGPNLRNNFAHGLETNGLAQSIYAFYAWWLVFRMIMLLRRADEKPPA